MPNLALSHPSDLEDWWDNLSEKLFEVVWGAGVLR
jgi:hypothetical protein